MSEQQMAWFHCGRCGSLFRARTGNRGDRECTECGRDPSLIGLPTQAKRTAIPEPRPPADSDASTHTRRETKKEEKPSLLPLKLVIVWLLLLGGVVWLFQIFEEDDEATEIFAPTAQGTMADERVVFLNEALPACGQALSGFLTAGTMEARSQFVANPTESAGKMTRFYSQNPLPSIEATGLSYLRGAILELPDGRAIESIWKAKDGREIEAVFRRHSGEWRLDWEHFARFGDYPWSLFLAGVGGPDGEFRLYARERLADRRLPGESLSLVFHAPKFGEPGRMSEASPEFVVEPGTLAFGMLDAAFNARRAERIPFGSMLPKDDPRDMIRARVKIRRVEETNEDGETVRRYVLDEVLACHWMSIDDPGVPSAEDLAKPATE